jgi:hypothetical protein
MGRAQCAELCASPRSTYKRAAQHLVPPHKDSGCCIDRPGLATHHRPKICLLLAEVQMRHSEANK